MLLDIISPLTLISTQTSLEILHHNGPATLIAPRQAHARPARTHCDREDLLVVDVLLHPLHEQRDVLISGQRRGLLVGGSVGPQVLELRDGGLSTLGCLTVCSISCLALENKMTRSLKICPEII